MNASARFLTPAEAANALGVSAKALRLYEQRGLVDPGRSAAGWRAYSPQDMAHAAEIVALRALGLSLAQVEQVLAGDASAIEPALAHHQQALETRMRELGGAVARVRDLRSELAAGQRLDPGGLSSLISAAPRIGLDLPWPWGGERFELDEIAPLNYIIGPLGSGKTRLAMKLAETIPGAVFVGLDRLSKVQEIKGRLATDPALKASVDEALAWLVDDGATASEPLLALLVALAEGPQIQVIDMIEQGLDQATQEALIAHLRHRNRAKLFMLTRSSAILDLAEVGAGEAIILCPANHSPPSRVLPFPGAPGYEAVATCLASPEVRARTEGVIAMRPEVA